MVDEKHDAHSDQPQQKQPRKGSSKKLLIIIASAILVLVVGGFLAYTMLSGAKGKAGEAEYKEEKNKGKTVLIPLDPFVVNLSDPGRYVKVTMQFELADASHQAMVTQKIPNLRDAVITLLSSKSAESVSGPEGKFQLKDEILLRANQAVGKDVFRNLYFTDFVMQ